VKNETYSYEETDSCFLSFTARGFKIENKIPNLRILISINLEKISALNLTQLSPTPQIEIFLSYGIFKENLYGSFGTSGDSSHFYRIFDTYSGSY